MIDIYCVDQPVVDNQHGSAHDLEDYEENAKKLTALVNSLKYKKIMRENRPNEIEILSSDQESRQDQEAHVQHQID